MASFATAAGACLDLARPRPSRWPTWIGRTLVFAYLATVAVLTILHAVSGWPDISLVALTPQMFAHGQLWLVASSAFLVSSGSAAAGLLSLLLVAGAAAYLRSAPRFARAAIAGHVGSTIVTYAGIGTLLLLHVHAVDGLIDQPDYGTSCVFAGALGAITVQARRERHRIRRLGIAAAAWGLLAAMTVGATGLALPEHLIAFALGAAVSVHELRGRFPGRAQGAQGRVALVISDSSTRRPRHRLETSVAGRR